MNILGHLPACGWCVRCLGRLSMQNHLWRRWAMFIFVRTIIWREASFHFLPFVLPMKVDVGHEAWTPHTYLLLSSDGWKKGNGMGCEGSLQTTLSCIEACIQTYIHTHTAHIYDAMFWHSMLCDWMKLNRLNKYSNDWLFVDWTSDIEYVLAPHKAIKQNFTGLLSGVWSDAKIEDCRSVQFGRKIVFANRRLFKWQRFDLQWFRIHCACPITGLHNFQ